MAPYIKIAALFVIGGVMAGCHASQEKASLHFLHLTTDNVNGKLIRAVEHTDVSELKYNGRGMQLQVHHFGDVPLNLYAEQSSDKGKHIELVELSSTLDLTHDQWKPVFEAWFHKEAAIPANQSLHPTVVTVNKHQVWQYTSAMASTSSVSRYMRAYLIPECKHAIVIQSRGWASTDTSSYNPYLDELASSVDFEESH